MARYGKDHPEKMKGATRFIEDALTGGSGPSNGIHDMSIDRKSQSIKTATPMDNVQLAMRTRSSICDEGGFRGGPTNLAHSIKGASAPGANDVGAAGPVKHVIIPNH